MNLPFIIPLLRPTPIVAPTVEGYAAWFVLLVLAVVLALFIAMGLQSLIHRIRNRIELGISDRRWSAWRRREIWEWVEKKVDEEKFPPPSKVIRRVRRKKKPKKEGQDGG